jgi:hypothetical protein
MLSHGVSLLHSSLTSRKNIEARLPMKLSEVRVWGVDGGGTDKRTEGGRWGNIEID